MFLILWTGEDQHDLALNAVNQESVVQMKTHGNKTGMKLPYSNGRANVFQQKQTTSMDHMTKVLLYNSFVVPTMCFGSWLFVVVVMVQF